MRGKLRQVDWPALGVATALLAVLVVTLVLAARQSAAAFLPALIAGGAGVGGAWLGGRAAQRAAETHGRTEHRAWTRDRRERAYARFLDARDRYVESWIATERWTAERARQSAWLEDNAEDLYDTRDEQLADEAQMRRTRLREAAQRRAAESLTLQEARPEFHIALLYVELFASKRVRDAARAWATDIEKRYEWIFETFGYVPEEVNPAREQELAQHRNPFLDLIREELLIEDPGGGPESG